MRPIKLTMSAFGSYAKVETIDFTRFYDKNIFLITGPTGAGKTTIFDGICYALYGFVSSSDKDQGYIRNDIADDDILTYVELEFELKEKTYYIKRSPAQRRKKVRGDGYTEQAAAAELNIIGDDEVLTSVSEVNNKIVEMVGLEYDQFKQIIMIPQGEFRQLITAKSKEREEILRRIFGTSEYRKLQDALEKMTKGLREDIIKLEEGLKTNIRNISTGNNENLKALIAKDNLNSEQIKIELISQIQTDKNEIEDYEKKLSKLEEESKEIQKKITEGKYINDKLQRKREIKDEKAQLESRHEEIKMLKASLVKGKKALSIKILEDSYDKSLVKVKAKEKEIQDAYENLVKAEKMLELAENELTKQLSRSEEIDKLKGNLGLYSSFIEKVKNYEDKKKDKEELDKSLKKIKNELDVITKSLDHMKNTANELKERKESLKNCEKDHNKLELELQKKEGIYKKIESIIPLITELEQLRRKYKDGKSKHLFLEKQYTDLKIDVEDTRRKFIEGYAGKLAKELENKKPCPVCGSIHHPYPAKPIEGVPSEDELKLMEQRLDELDERCKASSDNVSQIGNQGNVKKQLIAEKKKEISEELNEDIDSLEGKELSQFAIEKEREIQLQINEMKSKLAKLNEEIEEGKEIESDLNELENKKESTERKKEDLNTFYTNLFAKVESESNLIQELEKELPEEVRTENGLKKKITELEAQIDSLEAAIKEAQDKQQKCKDGYTALTNTKQEREKNLIEAKAECDDLRDKFEEQIFKQGFIDEEEYRNAKLTEEEIANIDNQIKEYNEKLISVKDRYEQILKEARDMETVDISDLENKLVLKEQEKNSSNDKRTMVFSRLNQNKVILDNIKVIKEKVSAKAKEYSLVGELSSTANGRNDYKVTFETYVLAAYFEDIIDAANLRFRKMTKNRFQMDRIKEEGRGNAFRGLDINVMDGNSGQYRPIKNISGGESFKASLSLALGLADVVQSYAGGIKLDTMFIDEGFGSLDSASLDDAINCLLELQSSGRLVGIISHVKELQERITSRIEIEPSVEGSRVRYVY
ncbi:AAA family ATPase [Proteiniborus sp. MB09-C3]|uniref:AAA family ATPase n=1 Tax=Proteiniborus sp. MB09-C3 TaxID=3050072 RepID=UPI002556E004|nr:AAA family ATPase [Proteiniborus sp. MB09-C3]WIV12094.1 AAA family ATPase [Proteiniborus sp. MB09-C3]